MTAKNSEKKPRGTQVMSDLETIKAIFTKRGVGFTIADEHEGTELTFGDGDPTFAGYSGFYGWLSFDENGNLIGTGAGE